LSNPLKILFIPRWYPNRTDALNGIFIKRHALAVAMKHQVAVLYVNADPNLKDTLYEIVESQEDKILTICVYYNNSVLPIPIYSSVVKFFRYLVAGKIGAEVIKNKFGNPDISHIHVLSRTSLLAKKFNAPTVISEQWSGYLPEDGAYKGFLKKWITKAAINNAKAVSTVSKSLKDAMLSHGLKNNYSIIPNVVDVSLFSVLEKNIEHEKIILLHVSNLDDRAKNVSGMIQAVGEISKSRSDFEFHIVGDGPDREKLEKVATENNLLNKHVFFLGTKSSAEVAEKMKQSDLFLLFSNYDNMPCVMIEAFASGLPVVGSNMHGIGEHVKEGRGFAVKAGDVNAFANATLKAMNELHLFNKQEIRAYATNNFSYEAVSSQFDQVYQKCIKQ